MDIIISVLVVLALFAGIALGTFRHRIYGVWSFFGVLLAMNIANLAGSLFGTYLTTTVNGDMVTVTVLVQITLVVVISLLVSYYCDNLIPMTPDPKNRSDNIYAGTLGFVNAYLIVGSILGYLKAIPNADPQIAGNIFANSFNDWLFYALPWMILATFFYVIGWASVRKIRAAITTLKDSMQKSTPQPTSNTTGSLPVPVNNGYSSSPSSSSFSSPSSSFSSPYTPSSSVSAAIPVAAAAAVATIPEEPKQGFLGRLFGGFGRKEEEPVAPPPPANPSPTGFGSYGLGSSAGYGASSTGYQSPMSNPSGATPPYGISTGSITGANPSYGTPAPTPYQSPTQSSFGGYSSASYTPPPPPPAPSYTPSSGFGQLSSPSSGFGQPSSPSSGFGQPSSSSSGYQPTFGASVPSGGYTPASPFGANAGYNQQNADNEYDQSTYEEDNDKDDDNEGFRYNGPSEPQPYRG
jgi:hypothetical protein